MRARAVRRLSELLALLLGTADGRTVGAVAARELSLILRSRDWCSFLMAWGMVCAGLLVVPLLWRNAGHWRYPSQQTWFLLGGYGLQGGLGFMMFQWTIRRLRHDLYSSRLDELILTRCSPADLAMGEALGAAVASLWMALAAFPACLFLAGMAGRGLPTAIALLISIAPAGGLGVWLGMGWGLAFTLQRPGAAVSPFTDWWIKGSLYGPAWLLWAALVLLVTVWAVMPFIPGGLRALLGITMAVSWVVQQIARHWNPFLTVGGALGVWGTTWLTDWLVLAAILLFMMRKSMDSVQMALGVLPERDHPHYHSEAWIHHDVHYFLEYGADKRRIPKYRDGGDAVAAFDIALGHRVFLHPFLWAVMLIAYLFLITWSLMLPKYGQGTATAAVLIPATAALLLMSGGVAISFGWERDQHRWPSLAMVPVDDFHLALGKILGVVRPTLWLGLMASATALMLGWRGALHPEASLWMALHVMVFPVALACVTATMALTTATLSEALFRWALGGAIPTLAFLLPPPIGGLGGVALPFTPPLLVLMIVIEGPVAPLVRGAWISLGLEVFGIAASLLVMKLLLRRLTVGEKD